MTTISQKDKILLGYDPNSVSRTPPGISDIDFSDVFGGPPRRTSHQSEENDGDTWRRGDGEGNSEMGAGRSRSWSINPGEKPVFGSEVSSRRRHQGLDFFDDIFRGDQSQASSPRKSFRDPMSSSPGSRILSPARPLPPGAVPLGSPAQFSLPAKLQSSHSFSNLSRQSPLSHKAAAAADREVYKKDDNLEGIGGETQVKNAGNHFHFSIHKWASKGVPLVMSLGKKNSLKSKIMLERSLSLNDDDDDDEVESDTLVGQIQPVGANTDDVRSFTVHVVSAAKDSKESDQIVDKSDTDIPNLRTVLKKSASKDLKNVPKPDIDAIRSVLKRSSSKLGGLEGKTGNDSAVPEVRYNKRVVENKSAPSSNVDKKEHIEEVGKSKPKEHAVFKGDSKKNNVKDQKNLGNDRDKEKLNKSSGINNSTEKVKGETEKDGAKVKVKEFVKIFNKEPKIRTIADLDGLSPSGRWRNVDGPREDSKATLSSAKTDVNSSFDPSPKVDESSTSSSGKHFDAKNVQKTYQSSFMESETKASGNLEASSADVDMAAFDSILIEELPQVQDKTSENSENTEDMQAYESKILKWSKGKEGNIRALLSTLQYVLWPDSGWKPVPLVNIIEATAVKRSYQRALLYLHPDKLQQKGAAPYQKFIAEKVFDILQEAWNQFSNLGSL